MKHKCDGCIYKGEHLEMMFQPFNICTKEPNIIDAENAYNAEMCPYHIKMNIYDNENRILLIGRCAGKMESIIEELSKSISNYQKTIIINKKLQSVF